MVEPCTDGLAADVCVRVSRCGLLVGGTAVVEPCTDGLAADVCLDVDYLSVALRWLNHEVAGLCVANDVQQAAVKHALVNSFSLIQGPPGTGKTLTAVRLAALFIRINHSLPDKYRGDRDRKPQLLVCGPSNKAVDVIASELTFHSDDVVEQSCMCAASPEMN